MIALSLKFTNSIRSLLVFAGGALLLHHLPSRGNQAFANQSKGITKHRRGCQRHSREQVAHLEFLGNQGRNPRHRRLRQVSLRQTIEELEAS
jgi:hypothetical protein